MSFALNLASYNDVRENAEAIYEKLADGSMPCDDAWPPTRCSVSGLDRRRQSDVTLGTPTTSRWRSPRAWSRARSPTPFSVTAPSDRGPVIAAAARSTPAEIWRDVLQDAR